MYHAATFVALDVFLSNASFLRNVFFGIQFLWCTDRFRSYQPPEGRTLFLLSGLLYKKEEMPGSHLLSHSLPP